MHLTRGHVRVALLLMITAGLCLAQNAAPGTFFIVGMGTAPDLVTVRAQKTITRADILMAEAGEIASRWSEYARGKEVWEYPRSLRRFYGARPEDLPDPRERAEADKLDKLRRELTARIAAAVRAGKVVANLQSGDPMMYGMTLFLELLPSDIPTEIVPGVGAFQAASAALKRSPPYGYDTNAVILTLDDWPGRVDVNDKLMAAGSTMVFYTMHLNYPRLFEQLKRHYPADTPVAVVSDAGDLEKQQVIRSTVGRFLAEVDYKALPVNRHMLFVGKFLVVGQKRKDFVRRILEPEQGR